MSDPVTRQAPDTSTTDETANKGRSRRPQAFRSVALLLLLVFAASSVFGVAALVLDPGSISSPALGRREEAVFMLPDDIPFPMLVDSTQVWGLNDRPAVAGVDAMAGGLSIGDLDNDGDLDLVVTHGSVEVYLWNGDHYNKPQTLTSEAISSTLSDVDLDGWLDALVARDGTTDLIIWGGPWITEATPPQDVTPLPGAAPTSLLLAGELSGDGLVDVVRLGRGTGRGIPDILWQADPGDPREFRQVAVGEDRRVSLAAELVDVDEDGLLDIWVTRDVGWDVGGDSIYSRQGESGEWVDIAPHVGAELEVDGMGVTMADLNDDGALDAYVSDLGDNEVLLRNGDQFEPAVETGAARIRPTGAPSTTISSSWATGATDANLDGRLDLIVVNGGFADGGMRNKIPGTEIAVADPPSILLGIGDGRFVDVWPQMNLTIDASNRALAVADIDGDGDDDYILLSDSGAVRAFENVTNGSTVTVEAADGCDPTGAKITISAGGRTYTTLMRPHSYGGNHSPAVIAGIVDAAVTVRIEWADATATMLQLDAEAQRSTLIAQC